jgi:hypothetical protein
MLRPVMKTFLMGLVFAGCVSPVMHFGGGKSATEAQHDTLAELLPAQLAIEGPWQGPVRNATIRVYADDDYRAQNIHWRETFGESLEYANAVLGPNFGVRLVADYREWTHHAPGYTLAEHLDELMRVDPGDDVLSVIGLTSSLGLVSATFDMLGYASVPGRHMIVRGYSDLEERRAFESAFPDLSGDEREHALEARRRHKTAAVLLHELAHNLGAPHETREATLMNASYSAQAAAFSADANGIIQYTLDQRLGRSGAGDAPIAQPAAAHQVQHQRMYVHVTADAVLIEGKPCDRGCQNGLFSMQAALDDETDVVIEKDKGVASSRVVEVIDRAKAQGLQNFSLR